MYRVAIRSNTHNKDLVCIVSVTELHELSRMSEVIIIPSETDSSISDIEQPVCDNDRDGPESPSLAFPSLYELGISFKPPKNPELHHDHSYTVVDSDTDSAASSTDGEQDERLNPFVSNSLATGIKEPSIRIDIKDPIKLSLLGKRPKSKDESVREIVVHVDPSWEFHEQSVKLFKESGIFVESKNPQYDPPMDSTCPAFGEFSTPIRIYRMSITANNDVMLVEEPFRFAFIPAAALVQLILTSSKQSQMNTFNQIIDRWIFSHTKLNSPYGSTGPVRYSICCYNFTKKHLQRLDESSDVPLLYHNTLINTQLYSKTKPWITVLRNFDSMIGWLVEFIRISSFLPYRATPFTGADSSKNGFFQTQSKGAGPNDTFFKMLCEIPQVSEAVAKSICQPYPTLGHLLKAYTDISKCPHRSEEENLELQQNMLADLIVTRSKTEKRIGEGLSTKIFQVFLPKVP
jgi:hypothetical protein